MSTKIHPRLSRHFPRVGVRDSDFFHAASPLHGPSHVNRVMALASALCAARGDSASIARVVWASVFLHDLARTHDRPCCQHGATACGMMGLVWPQFVPYGVTPYDLPRIITAVTLHCMDTELPKYHDHYEVVAILKDADALDRVRLDDLDVTRLRLPQSALLLPLARSLYGQTGNDPTIRLDDVLEAFRIHTGGEP